MSEHKGQVAGYVRVSAADQNEARQRADSGVPKARVALDLGASRPRHYAALSDTGKSAELAGA